MQLEPGHDLVVQGRAVVVRAAGSDLRTVQLSTRERWVLARLVDGAARSSAGPSSCAPAVGRRVTTTCST